MRYAVSLVRRLHLDHVAAHAEPAAREHRVVADVLRVDQRAQQLVAVVLGADLEDQHPLAPLLRRAEAVDAARRDATTTTSRRVRSELVAPSRSRAMSSFCDESFSM